MTASQRKLFATLRPDIPMSEVASIQAHRHGDVAHLDDGGRVCMETGRYTPARSPAAERFGGDER